MGMFSLILDKGLWVLGNFSSSPSFNQGTIILDKEVAGLEGNSPELDAIRKNFKEGSDVLILSSSAHLSEEESAWVSSLGGNVIKFEEDTLWNFSVIRS